MMHVQALIEPRRTLGCAAATLLLFAPVMAQDEEALKKAFEGKRVILKIDMPATSAGVDVWPERDTPVDFPELGKRLRQNGIALRPGQEEMITKVHVVKNHIEFQLGGGGYGTFADLLSSPYQAPPIYQGETAEERRLKEEIATTKDSRRRRSLEHRLSDLERQRQADNAYAETQVAQANLAAESEIRERRLTAGSRFNIRWKKIVPPESLTPEAVMSALEEYVDFSSSAETTPNPTAGIGPGAGQLMLRKGMTVEEVEQLLGPARSVTTGETSGIELMTRTYSHPEHRVVARFASEVLVDFAITPH